MRRLTPDKIYGYTLPKSERINKGNTSIIYKTDDPAVLEVFTIEVVKMEWWQRGLHIIEDFDEVANAHYAGYSESYKPNSYYDRRREYKSYKLPVYRALVRRLDTPDKAQMTRIRQIQRAINTLSVAWHYNESAAVYRDRRWNAIWQLSMNKAPEIRSACEFIFEWGYSGSVYPDFGAGDFMVKDGEIIALDPFHHADITSAVHLYN